MKRQALRNTLILVSFLFFPLTIFYLSPVQMVQAASLGVIRRHRDIRPLRPYDFPEICFFSLAV